MGGTIFATPNGVTEWRAATVFSEERDALAWIASFQPDEVSLDVGANVGMYTVWAAMTRGKRVYAFEPESQNCAILNRNTGLDGLGSKASAYCLALSDHTGFGSPSVWANSSAAPPATASASPWARICGGAGETPFPIPGCAPCWWRSTARSTGTGRWWT